MYNYIQVKGATLIQINVKRNLSSKRKNIGGKSFAKVLISQILYKKTKNKIIKYIKYNIVIMFD